MPANSLDPSHEATAWLNQRQQRYLQSTGEPQRGGFGGSGDIPDITTPSPRPEWQRFSNTSDIPLTSQQQWRISREQQDLAEARARSALPGHGPIITSYGPGSWRGSSGIQPPVREYHDDDDDDDDDDISPAPPVPWQTTNGQDPSMHYRDGGYFGPESASPKDETQVEGAFRQDTSPGLPDTNRPEARRSWDRQRRRRKRTTASAATPGGNGGSNGGPFPRRAGSHLGGHFMDWAPEIMCLILSLVCLAAIVAVMKLYDGRSLANWPLAISLNALVAFLEAICRVSLVVPVTEGISQLKWNSFARRERPLVDFETFDDAVRTPIGSAGFIFKRKGRYGKPLTLTLNGPSIRY